MLQISAKHYRHAVVLTAVLFLCTGRASAIPISDYQHNLKQAIAALETLLEMDEGEVQTAGDYEQELNSTIESIRVMLPQSQTIETRDVSYNVDNAWLHKALDQLADSSADDHFEKIGLLIQSLQAIEIRIAEREVNPPKAGSKEEAKAKLESILARPEYVAGAKGPNALSRLLRDFMNWLRKFLPKPPELEPRPESRLGFILQIVVIVIALLVLLYVARLLLKRFKRS